MLRLGLAALGFWAATVVAAPHQHEPPVVLAPGYAELEFEPPAVGSYLLPTMGDAADGAVLGTDDKAGDKTGAIFLIGGQAGSFGEKEKLVAVEMVPHIERLWNDGGAEAREGTR